MILELERDWGKEPGWLSTLDPDQQALVLGERQCRAQESKRRRMEAQAAARTASKARR